VREAPISAERWRRVLSSIPIRPPRVPSLAVPVGSLPFVATALAAPVVVVAGLSATYSPQLVFGMIAAVLLAVLTFRWLLAGTVLFIIVTFPAELPGAIGAGATIAKPFGIVLACSWLLTLVSNRKQPFLFRDRPVLGAFLAAYVAWALLSLLWSASPGDTVYEIERLAQAVLLMVVIFSVAGKPREFAVLLWGYLAASAVTAGYALASGVAIAGGRLTGGVNDPNYLASELVLAIVAGAYLFGTTRRLPVYLVILAAVGTDLAAFLLTQSRGGIFGIGVGVVAAIVVAGRTRATVLAVTAIAAASVVGYFALIAPAAVKQRVTDFSTSSSAGRTDAWQIAWKITQAHPFTGVALGGYRNEQLKYIASSIDVQHVTYILDTRIVVHNTYLETLAELGFVGFLLLGGAIFICVRSGWKAIRIAESAGDESLANAFRGLVAGSCGLFAAYVFVSAEYEKQLWIALALLAASSSLAARRLRERVEAPPNGGADRPLLASVAESAPASER
jgi:O-antigen ligase